MKESNKMKVLFPIREGGWEAWLTTDGDIDVGRVGTVRHTITLQEAKDCNELIELLKRVKKYFNVVNEQKYREGG